eukprot:3138776-Pyramimonas_sp.AAC.1
MVWPSEGRRVYNSPAVLRSRSLCTEDRFIYQPSAIPPQFIYWPHTYRATVAESPRRSEASPRRPPRYSEESQGPARGPPDAPKGNEVPESL